MIPRMTAKESELFLAFLRNSTNYVEFGTGGSTVLASQHVKSEIISIDSSQEWLDKVLLACQSSPVKPKLIYVDIGPTGPWGVPTEPATRAMWPKYHENIWNIEGGANGDLYLIDGRFRVACFAQTALHCKKGAFIAFHDFASRKQYHCVHAIAREIATSEDMSIFVPAEDIDAMATNIIEKYKYAA